MRRVMAAIVVLLATQMCASAEPSAAGDFATASNTFAADLFGQVRTQQGNLCVSPYSVSTALAMTAVGARGETQTQMLGVLHWTQRAEQLSTDVAAMTKLTVPPNEPSGGPAFTGHQTPILRVCNSLWGAAGLNYEPAFQSELQKDFGAEVHTVDFNADPEAARSLINAWASDATAKRIPSPLPANSLRRSTRLVLVNAVYFKAGWASEFNPRLTQDQPFHLDTGDAVTAPLMHRQSRYNYAEDDRLQIVELPYFGDFSMVVILPRKRDGLAELESTFTAETLRPLAADHSFRTVDLFLPKFTFHGQYELKQPLIRMGMKNACTAAADFSGITTSEPLMIDAVSHGTFIAVDEKGTEAAAVTAITVAPTAIFRRPEEPVVFRADHPFLFVIRQNQTGAILFMGRVSDPTK